jgi:hypothetical protein
MKGLRVFLMGQTANVRAPFILKKTHHLPASAFGLYLSQCILKFDCSSLEK